MRRNDEAEKKIQNIKEAMKKLHTVKSELEKLANISVDSAEDRNNLSAMLLIIFKQINYVSLPLR